MSNSTCFFPGGPTVGASNSAVFVPCDPSAPESACCAVGETCVGSGLCLSVSGLIYRGGCTDASFANSACPSFCKDAAPSRNSNDSTGNIRWVCGLGGNCSDTTAQFEMLVGPVKEVNVTGSVVNSATSTSTSSITPSSTSTSLTSTSTSGAKKCSNETAVSATIVGAGVAIPLAVLLLLSIVWAMWERRKSSKYAAPINVQDYRTVLELDNKSYVKPQEVPDNVMRSTHELS